MKFKKALNKKYITENKLVDYSPDNKNYKVLELTKNAPGAWKKYKKQGGVFAYRTDVSKTIQTKEGQKTAKPGEWVCMGIEGEKWPVSAENFGKKYLPDVGEKKVDGEETFFWHKVNPGSEVAALQMHVPFTISTSWGETLTSKAGDYILKNYSDIDNPDPKDVWPVDQAIFKKTYKEEI